MKFLNLISVFFSRPRKSILMLLVVSSTASALTPVPDEQQPTPDSSQTDSKFASEIEQLQQDIAKLKLKEQKAKLEDSIAKTISREKTGKPIIDKAASIPTQVISDSEDAQISIRSIFGVNRSYQAVISYHGAEITVKRGSDIDGSWKVMSISASTVQIRNGKTGKRKTLTLSAPQAQPAQASTISPPSMSMPPVMPFALPPTIPDATQISPSTPGL
jgi:type IV pilus biogenesis protein PilP